MPGVQIMEVGPEGDGQRLDRWFRGQFPQVTQGRLEKMLRKGEVRVNGGRVKANARLESGQSVRVPPLPDAPAPAPVITTVSAADSALMRELVIYQDDWLIALNKPPGLPVQGGSGQSRHIDGMLDALAGGADRPKLVHRLDKDTSGVLVLARTGQAARALTGAFHSKAARKLYWAAVARAPKPAFGTITYALMKAPGHGPHGAGEKMICIDPRELTHYPEAKRAVTDYATVEAVSRRAAWVALRPVTGRTHQLRAHMAEIGCPIVGDGKYGTNAVDGGAQLGGEISRKLHLHARSIELPHPAGGGRILRITAPLPEHMRRSWETFGWDINDDGDPFEAGG